MSQQVAALAFGAGVAAAYLVRTRSGRDVGVTKADGEVQQKIKELCANTTIVVFSKSYCPFCRKVKAIFKELGFVAGDEMAIVELDLTSDGAQCQAALLEITKQRTVPNVWIKGQHIGGADDTAALYDKGELQRLLGMPVSSPKEVGAPPAPMSSAAPTGGGPAFHVAYGAS